jgi:uncharacterized OsmC-like protein
MMEQHQVARAERQLNGVNLDRLQRTIEAIKTAPALARFTFRALNRWMKGSRSRTTVQGFWGAGSYNDRESFVIDSDTPDLMLGSNEAPNPFEYFLHSLIACLTLTFVHRAALRRVRIQALESRIEGDLDLHGFFGMDEDSSKGFHEVRAIFRAKADCTGEELQELIELTKRHSPVFRLINAVAPISVSCEAM